MDFPSTNSWDCPVAAVALFGFVSALLLVPWIVGWLRTRSRAAAAIAQILFWGGTGILLLHTIHLPDWGIRIRETPDDSAVIYGAQARIALLLAAAAVLINLALARRRLGRRV
ncbi:MAG: hypothetical protein M3P06_14525 [Acidobacteriota bacterium]|nr:hypothetical protein [Acidobacteriota bacterium]